jgi:hypothetical protein
MKNDYLRSLMEKGEIVHFSAADGNRIKISENSKNLKRYQLNYLRDITLARADPGSETGGYKIKGVNSFGVVNSNLKDWGYKNPLHDFHYDSKTFKMTWDFLKVLQLKINSGATGTIKLEKSDLKSIDNWDHRDGSRGQKIPNNLS